MIDTTAVRSLLFVPASDERKLRRARNCTADAVILDLEDSVEPGRLPAARRQVARFLADAPADVTVFVRPHHPSSAHFSADVAAAVAPGLAGVVIPKVESPDDVDVVARALDEAEPAAGLDPGSTLILPLLESGLGLHHAYAVAGRSERVPGLAFSSGEQGDFMADIDGVWSPDGAALSYARGRTVAECRAAGRSWPVDGVFMGLDDPDALELECRLARRHGFLAKMAIHPAQLPVIHAVFTPSAEEVAAARRIIEGYRAAVAAGLGAARIDGRMVDLANVAHAERVLARSRTTA